MKLPHYAVILLMSLASFAQSNPTTFTNTTTGYHSGDYVSTVNVEDGSTVNQSACPGGSGCFLNFKFSAELIGFQLPDFPNVVPACTITSSVVQGAYCCTTVKCQSVTYTAGQTGDDCVDINGQRWHLVTTQYRHWVRSGRYCFVYWEGGHGTLSH